MGRKGSRSKKRRIEKRRDPLHSNIARYGIRRKEKIDRREKVQSLGGKGR